MDNVDAISRLRQLRDSIDNIDAALIHMLAERFQRTQAIGRLKTQDGLASRDLGREASQVTRLRELAAVSKLGPDFAEASSPLSFVKSFASMRRDRAGCSKVHPRNGRHSTRGEPHTFVKNLNRSS